MNLSVHVDTIHGRHWQIDAAMEDLWNMTWMACCYTEARITHLLGGSANSRHDPGRGQRSLRGREEGRTWRILASPYLATRRSMHVLTPGRAQNGRAVG